MRKQTKLVAVLSAAALLALGASMTSFAATAGWQEEDGTWVYLDKNGNRVSESWKKSGDNWFWLDENGEMTTDALVEYKDNYYYVDENGAMVANKWVALDNEDAGDDDEPDQWWYYFQGNGKAYKRAESATNATFKTINGKKYTFDEDGKMMYGWLDITGDRLTDEDTNWSDGIYYCGDQNDGAQRIGWMELTITDPSWESDVQGNWSSKNTFDDEEQTRWFYFESNGKKMRDKTGKTINGRKYSFDSQGRMNAEWVYQAVAGAPASPLDSTTAQANATASYAESWRFFGSPEDGARVTKGWFKVVPGEYLNMDDYNDDEDAWFYGETGGSLAAGKFKTIKSKKYGFKTNGAMLDGLKLIRTTNGTDIEEAYADDSNDAPYGHFDTEDGFLNTAKNVASDDSNLKFYYFGGEDDGAMKTGKTSIEIDGDKFNFYLTKSGSYKGSGFNGVDDKKLYVGGMNVKADKDDKYKIIKVKGTSDSPANWQFVDKMDVSDVIAGQTAKILNGDQVWEIKPLGGGELYVLVNTTGSVQKTKSNCKDGNDYKISVKNYEVSEIRLED